MVSLIIYLNSIIQFCLKFLYFVQLTFIMVTFQINELIIYEYFYAMGKCLQQTNVQNCKFLTAIAFEFHK